MEHVTYYMSIGTPTRSAEVSRNVIRAHPDFDESCLSEPAPGYQPDTAPAPTKMSLTGDGILSMEETTLALRWPPAHIRFWRGVCEQWQEVALSFQCQIGMDSLMSHEP
jgi:hypothetical protein